MSVRYTQASLDHGALLEIVPHGTEFGEDEVTRDAGLIVNYDDAFLLEGDFDTLIGQLRRAADALEEMRAVSAENRKAVTIR